MTGMRERVMGMLHDVFTFGKITASAIGVLKNSLTVSIEADDGETDGSHEVWGSAPVMWRPVDPDLTGECEVLFARLGDEKIAFATRDLRWQISVEKGEVIITSMGSTTPAYVHLKPDGTVVLSALVVKIGSDAAAQSIPLGTLLQTWLSTHTHATGTGPSGPPNEAGTLSTCFSARHKVDS